MEDIFCRKPDFGDDDGPDVLKKIKENAQKLNELQSEYKKIEVSLCGELNSKSIRIYHECEGRIEKSVPRIAVWHHQACRVMTNHGPEGQIFLFYPHTNNGFYSCSPLFFLFKTSSLKSLNMLR